MLTGTNALDWIRGLELLSLDFIRPIYGALGVGVMAEETLRGLARDTLAGRFSNQSTSFELSSWSNPDETNAVWIVPFVAVAERALGARDTARVKHWILYVYGTDETRNPWIEWEDCVSSWARRLLRSGEDSMGLSISPLDLARKVVASRDVGEPMAQLTRQLGQPLSSWDLPRFHRLGFDETSTELGFVPFVDPIALAIRMFRFQQLWREFFAGISIEDRDRIEHVRRQSKDSQGMRLEHLEELPIAP